MLICAEDGWVCEWENGEAPDEWNYMGLNRYQSTKIFCLTKHGEVELAKPIYNFSNFISKFLSSLFNSKVSAKVIFSKEEAMGVESFKSLLVKAVKKDDDILTQLESSNVIIEAINKANDYDAIQKLYKIYGWV